MEQKNIAAELGTVYQILATLSVSGDAVDAMAAVRAKLRRILAALIEEEAKQDG